jgi:DNA-binding CsgD family transcriptional regulator
MSLSLSSDEVTRLEAAIATALAPMAYDRVGEWRASLRRALEPLLGAHKSIFVLSADNEPTFECEPDILPAMAAYQAHFHALDPAFPRQARAFGHPVFNWWMLYEPSSLRRTEFYHDYVRRFRLFDPLVAMADSGTPFPSTLVFYHDRESGPGFGQRELDLLRLLVPALRSGVHILREVGMRRACVSTLVDRCAWCAALFDQEGCLTHENRALAGLLECEMEANAVRMAIRRAARATLGLGRPAAKSSSRHALGAGEHDVATSAARYRIRGTYLGAEILGRPAALVLVERLGPLWVPAERLQARYGLTPREVEVAGLLARGWSNSHIASELSMSIHTARRHVEHVLLKLEVNSRASVAAKALE